MAAAGRRERPEVRRPADDAEPPKPKLTGRAAMLFLVLALLVVSFAWPVREFVRQQTQLDQLRTQAAQTQARVDALEALKKRWADPAYVEAQARDRLHFVLPGETGYVVLGTPQPTQSDAPTQGAPPPKAWFSNLWDTVKAADAPPSKP